LTASSARSCFKSLLMAAVLLFVALPSGHVAPVQAAPADNTAASLKAAALDQAARLAPDVPVVSEEIARVVGDYAIVILYPPPGLTDPAMVILHSQDGVWTGIAGPGTAFPPGEDRGGAPDSLFDFTNAYVGAAGDDNLGKVPLASRLTYQSSGFSFSYPNNATAGLQDGVGDGTAEILGPYLAGPPFQGYGYEVLVRDLGPVQDQPLDSWAYDALQQETAMRQAQGGPVSTYRPQSVTYFHDGQNNVFQVDYFGGDSTIREFYVQNSAGGSVLGISTRVYPEQNNPSAPLAERAITLLLRSLQIGGN
jgi:hypothetical protein